jgi:polyisoprenoid-binding protein YceI
MSLVGTAVATDRIVLGPERLKLRFEVGYLGLLTVSGELTEVFGEARIDRSAGGQSTLKVQAAAASIRTGSAERDEVLMSARFFDAARHPTIEFTSAAVELTPAGHGLVTGDLAIRGISRRITLAIGERADVPARASPGGPPEMVIEAKGAIQRSQWGMTGLMPLVDDVVRLSIELRPPQHRRRSVARLRMTARIRSVQRRARPVAIGLGLRARNRLPSD